MPDFLQLHRRERAEILSTVSSRLGQAAEVLEKDVWVCWALDALFNMPGCPRMVFKGGTSLSKVYNAINRFSEDIDVTIDYHDFGIDRDPLQENLSANQTGKFRKYVESQIVTHLSDTLLPYFEKRLEEFSTEVVGVRTEDEIPGTFFIDYPSAVDDEVYYVQRRVLLEFGARNLIEPSENHRIVPTLMQDGQLTGLAFPTPTVPVLAAERTFWEKATLIHAENTRSKERSPE